MIKIISNFEFENHMGNKCCEAVVEPAIPDQIPLFKDFENHEWPEEDSYIHEWIK